MYNQFLQCFHLITKIIVMMMMMKMMMMGSYSGNSTNWLFIHCLQIELEFRSVDFCGGRKTGEPGEKPSHLGAGM